MIKTIKYQGSLVNDDKNSFFANLANFYKKFQDKFLLTLHNFYRLLPKALQSNTTFLSWLNKTYSYNNPSNLDFQNGLDSIMGDACFTCPSLFLAQQFRRAGAKVFFYKFSENRQSKTTPQWMGAVHGDEIEFVFGKPTIDKVTFTDQHKQLSRLIMSFYGDMAKTGFVKFFNVLDKRILIDRKIFSSVNLCYNFTKKTRVTVNLKFNTLSCTSLSAILDNVNTCYKKFKKSKTSTS